MTVKLHQILTIMNDLYMLPKTSKNLPCSIMPLEDWKLIKIEGKDAIQYSQSQLTCNIYDINKKKYTFAAHCNHRGKTINNMYVFYLNSGIGLIERSSICNKQIEEMKKYAIFSNIKIMIDTTVTLFGIAGTNARNILSKLFNTLPNEKNTLIYQTNIIILHFKLPEERFLLVIPNKIKENIINQLKTEMTISNKLQWLALDIESGYPIISSNTTETFLPQSINMHILNGISFNKGCYIGQEIIARTKYKKSNKRSLYWLIGNYKNYLPKEGSNLEVKNNHSWKETGIILASCQIDTGEIWVQAVLHNSISNESQFRLKDKKTILKISPLPHNTISYSMNNLRSTNDIL